SNQDQVPMEAIDLFQQDEAQRPLQLQLHPTSGSDSFLDGDSPYTPLYSEPRESLRYQANLRQFPLVRNRVAAVLMARKRAHHTHMLQLVHTYKSLERSWLNRQHAMLQIQLQASIGKGDYDGRRSSLRNRQTSD